MTMPPSEVSPNHRIMAPARLARGHDNATIVPPIAINVVEAALSQPDLKDKLDELFHEMGLGHDISAALKKHPNVVLTKYPTPQAHHSPKK
jgi:hypothetical protein